MTDNANNTVQSDAKPNNANTETTAVSATSIEHTNNNVRLQEEQIIDVKAKEKKSISECFNNLLSFCKQHLKTALFVSCTILPTLVVMLYTLFFYDNMYITETKFVIKSNSVDAVPSLLSAQSLLSGGTSTDMYIASAYLTSVDLFYKLNKEFNLIEHFSSHDIISSLPKHPTLKETSEYWAKLVSVDTDSESGLIRVRFRAYTPEMSLNVTKGMLVELDKLINQMNEKAHLDSISLATNEVNKAQRLVEESAEKIRAFRNEHTILDPTSEASNVMTLVSKLEAQLVAVQTEIDEKKNYLRGDSLEFKKFLNKSEILQRQINDTRARIAGKNNDNENQLSDTFGQYEKLIMQNEFAKKMLESAMTSLETSRQVSLTKSRYLVTLQQPNLPDESLWPNPFLASLLTFLGTVFGFGIISLIISAIREHAGI